MRCARWLLHRWQCGHWPPPCWCWRLVPCFASRPRRRPRCWCGCWRSPRPGRRRPGAGVRCGPITCNDSTRLCGQKPRRRRFDIRWSRWPSWSRPATAIRCIAGWRRSAVRPAGRRQWPRRCNVAGCRSRYASSRRWRCSRWPPTRGRRNAWWRPTRRSGCWASTTCLRPQVACWRRPRCCHPRTPDARSDRSPSARPSRRSSAACYASTAPATRPGPRCWCRNRRTAAPGRRVPSTARRAVMAGAATCASAPRRSHSACAMQWASVGCW